ncbi:class I SAM-dependent methyltransferase [Streptomyces sp. Isolate_45]|uniref:class I SAM-dependent methyltransferase n=1 Tax=Streptomyces sp. Isolate_45 TaxID=2950111 RepID=UPI002481D9EF|nr:class I SAM-dependent methyltransferase [Streptomyces sp. Isolate_45]MDA5282310.1 class I SAM-dependent methyltransferase [Streptomyces sp. Isolate_45]
MSESAEGPGPAGDTGGAAWSGSEGAQAYAAVEAATNWLLGYPFVFGTLSRRVGAGSVLVDYGCGPGKIADRAARRLGAYVIGVDISPQILALARTGARAVAEFHLVENGRVTALANGCADAVMCNHVLASLSTREAVLDVLKEIRRLLRPGGLFVLLSTDPAHSGTEYASLRIGEPGEEYGPGDQLTVRLLRTDGSWEEMSNHAWPVELLPGLLERAGFGDVAQHRPTVDEASAVADPDLVRSRRWRAERVAPPLVVTTAAAV